MQFSKYLLISQKKKKRNETLENFQRIIAKLSQKIKKVLKKNNLK